MRASIYGIPRDEKVHVSAVFRAAPVAAHDLDPDLAVRLDGFGLDEVEDLFALCTRDARVEVVVQRDTSELAGRQVERVSCRREVGDGTGAAGVQVVRLVFACESEMAATW